MPTPTIPSNGTLIRMLANYGVAGIMLAVVCVAFWCVALKPMADERKLLIDTLRETSQENTESVKRLADAMKEVGDQMHERGETFRSIDKTMQEVGAATQATGEALKLFTEEVRATHPEQTKKLDAILEKLNNP